VVVKKIVSLFKGKAFKIALLVALFLTSTLIALAMLLGREAGQFVIRVQDGDLQKSIAICEGEKGQPNTSKLTSKLSAPGVSGFTDYSPEYFLHARYQELDRIQAEEKPLYTVGNFSGATKAPESDSKLDGTVGCCLYVYTFYIVNTGTGAVGVTARLDYSNVTKGLDKCIRIMTYARDNQTIDPKIYQRSDEQKVPYPNYIIQPEEFKTVDDSSGSGVIFDDQTYFVNYEEGSNYLAYSIFFWIEGNDPDETEEIFGSTINFSLYLQVEM